MPGTVILVDAPTIRVNGTELSAAQYDAIVDLRVSQSVSIPSELTLRVSDPDFALLDGNVFAVGAAVVVSFPDAVGTAVTVFDGEVVAIGIDQSADRPDACELVLTGHDRSHRLGRSTKVRTFQNMSYSTIASQIAQEEGLSAEVTDTEVEMPYVIQTTTNYAFIDDMAFRAGYEWKVDGTKLVFGPRPATLAASVAYGDVIRRLKARFTTASEATSVTVRSWDPATKQVVTGTTSLSTARGQQQYAGTTTLGSTGRSQGASYNGTVSTSSLIALSTAEAVQLSEALGTRLGSADVSLRCECIGLPDVIAGSMVEITNAGTKLSGKYYVTSVEHHFGRATDLTTTFTTGAADSASIVDLLGRNDGRIEPFGHQGLTIGIVTNNKDPDGLGRVRVRFPALSDTEESWWARVVTPGAGSDAGLMFMPQIDDEVLLGFEHGDLRRPYVLGGLWGARAKPPTTAETFLAQNRVIEWGLKTAAASTFAVRGGQAPADKHFRMALADGTKLYLGADKVEVISGQNKSIELKSGQASVLITASGDVQLKGTNVTIEATSALKLNGLTVEAKGKTSATVEGGSTLKLTGNASAGLQSSGMTEVKGSLVKIN